MAELDRPLSQTGYRALVLGATGAVGSALVRELLATPRCVAVTILTRRKVDTFAGAPGAPKLIQQVIDLNRLEEAAREAAAGCDVACCTLGVGQPRKVSREELWRVDVEYAAAFARGCRAGGVRHFSLLTSVGADSRSRIYYLQVKGSVEQALRSLAFPRTSFFRPSLLVTRQIRYGASDRVNQWLFPRLSWLLPSRLRGIRVEDLARAIRINAERSAVEAAVELLHHQDFLALLRSDSIGR